jgi:hypothetical protein
MEETKHALHPLVEASLDNVEALVDSLADNELLKNIPVVGTVTKIAQGISTIRDKIFIAKIAKFVDELEQVSGKEREKVKKKAAENPNEARRVGETVLLVVERANEMDKPGLIARLFIAYVDGVLDQEWFRRLALAVDQAFVEDLLYLSKIDNQTAEEGGGPLRYLQHSGLSEAVIRSGAGGLASAPTFIVSVMGRQFISAMHHAHLAQGESASKASLATEG